MEWASTVVSRTDLKDPGTAGQGSCMEGGFLHHMGHQLNFLFGSKPEIL